MVTDKEKNEDGKKKKRKLVFFDPKTRRRRFLIYILYFCILFLYLQNRIFIPNCVVRSKHFIIESCDTREHARQLAEKGEVLYKSYKEFFKGHIKLKENHGLLRTRLYRDRYHFRTGSPLSLRWAEAYYFLHVCHCYYAKSSESPWSWFIHECTHQLNKEVAQMDNKKWLEEGIATYISCSMVINNKLKIGMPDISVYPAWWMNPKIWSGNFKKDLKFKRIIRLKDIINETEPLDMNRYFNLYYIQWWSIVHFMVNYDNGKYKEGFFKLIKSGGTLESFEKNIGPVDKIEKEWYRYLTHDLMKLVRKCEAIKREQRIAARREFLKSKNIKK